MINYNEKELEKIFDYVEKCVYMPTNTQCVKFKFYEEYRFIMSSVLVNILRIRKKRDFYKFSTGPLKYVVDITDGCKYISKEELKEIFDTIFLLELERVPLIINDFPNIARWRLWVGK